MSNAFDPQRSLAEVLEQRRALRASTPLVGSSDFVGKIDQKTEESVADFTSFVKEKLSKEETKTQMVIAEKEGVLKEFLSKLVFSATEAFHFQSEATSQLQAVFQNLAFFELTNHLSTPAEGTTRAAFEEKVENLDNQARLVVENNRAFLQNPMIADTVSLYVSKILQESGYQVSRDTIASLEDRIEERKLLRHPPEPSSIKDVEALLRNGLSRAIMCGSAVEANALIDQFELGLEKKPPQPLFRKSLRS